MAVGDTYAKVVGQGGAQNALSQFLNLKRAFLDAQRQQNLEDVRDQRKQLIEEHNLNIKNASDERQQRMITGASLAANGVFTTPDQFNEFSRTGLLTSGGNYFNNSQEEQPPPGMVKAGYNAKGRPYFRESGERTALLDMDKKRGLDYDKMADISNAGIDALESLKQSYYTGFTPVNLNIDKATLFDTTGAKISGLEKKIEAAIGKNPAAKAYLDQLSGFATTISRGGLAERGTLTDTDRKVVVKMFNLALASKAEADYAFDTIGNILSKPSVRAALYRMEKFKEPYESIQLPPIIRERVDEYIVGGNSPEESLRYILKKSSY